MASNSSNQNKVIPPPVIRLLEIIFQKSFNGDQNAAYLHYKTLKTRIRVLQSYMPEYKMISTYLENTHGPTHSFKLTIEEVYTTKRLNEYQRYKVNKSLGNRRILWHGTKIANLSSILANGLLTQPPSSAGITGKNFGNGIYFADVVTKAAQYCNANKNNPYGILILAEVALGKHYYLTSATSVTDLKFAKSSAKGLGKYKPDHTQTIRTKYGAQVPLGTLELQSNLTTNLDYSEYIIYNNDQLPDPVVRLLELIFDTDFKGDQALAYDHYKKLNTRIRVLSQNANDYTMIANYIKNTHGPTHKFTLTIENVFTVSRQGEYSRFKANKKLGKRLLLWHGTKTKNYFSILTNGLLVEPPPDVASNGKMFGKGVYFADVVTKSAQYCKPTKSNPYGILILADVVLGKHYYLTDSVDVQELKYSKSSVKGLGRYKPDPTKGVYTEHGAQVPSGPLIKHNDLKTTLDYSEYVVYDNDKILFEYLVLVKFHFTD